MVTYAGFQALESYDKVPMAYMPHLEANIKLIRLLTLYDLRIDAIAEIR